MKPYTIVWAIDAFQTHAERETLLKPTAEFINGLSDQMKAHENRDVQLIAVHVLSPRQINVEFTFSLQWLKPYREPTEQALRKLLDDLHLRCKNEGVVLMQPKPSTHDMTTALAHYAQGVGAEFILTTTHARKGFKRWVTGSFTETLLLDVRVPMVVTNPEVHTTAHLSKILLACDLSEEAKHIEKKSFDAAIELAAQLGSEVILYHAATLPVIPVIQSSGYLLAGAWQSPNFTKEFVEAELLKRKLLADQWAKRARQKGVNVTVAVETTTDGVVGGILAAAEREKVNLIATSAHTGPIATRILGSVTRHVVREAKVPVWVMRTGGYIPRAKKTKSAKPLKAPRSRLLLKRGKASAANSTSRTAKRHTN